MKHLSTHPKPWFIAGILMACLPGLSATTRAQTVTATYDLNNVWLNPSSGSPAQMTGTFQWTYVPGDFENGSGQFLSYQIPWWSSSNPPLQVIVDTGSIEFTMIGNFHGLGLDISLQFQTPLSPSLPSVLDTVRSKFTIEVGVIRTGGISGSIVPRCPPAQNYGSGSAGSGGVVPTIASSGGSPSIGNSAFGIDCNQLLGGASCLLLLGTGKSQLPFAGVTILVDPTAWFALPLQATGTSGAAGGGALQVPIPIPNNPLFVGAELDFQALAIDPGGSWGLAATDGLTATICT